MAAPAPHVLSIPPGAPFLPTLVDGLLDGSVVRGVAYRERPEALADLTLFLPTRRAARAFAGVLVDRLGAGAAILPRLRPLGDVDEDGGDGLTDPAILDLPAPMEDADRLTGFATLVTAWRRGLGPRALETPSGHRITIPASAADAVHLARDLLRLVDQAAVEGVDWSGLSRLVPQDYAGWWQLTLDFLTIAIDAWPRHLAERGRMDPVAHRTAVIRAVADRLARKGHPGPIVAAGSTGSQPATAALLSAVARLPAGAVVLPGLDLDLDDAVFDSLVAGREEGTVGHPQAALARLLGTMGIDRAEVRALGSSPADLSDRARIVSAALLPAGETHRWPTIAADLRAAEGRVDAALGGVAVTVAANEAEEALAIAVALRETLERPAATAALVTPDRALARRVASELGRFGIVAEDSAGIPLTRTPPGTLALLVADCVASGLDPVQLVALTRHPLATFGLPAEAARAAARILETGCLRGPRLAPGSAALVEAARTLPAARTERHAHAAVRRLDDDDIGAARDLANRIRDALAALEALDPGRPVGHRALLSAHLAALRAVAADEGGPDGGLFDGADGAALARFYAGHLDAGADLEVRPADLPGLLAALLQGETVRRRVPAARISIWGQLEARLMSVDRLVVGGLNEGSWPAATDTGPWLSRPMRASLGFAAPEQQTGLSAHDFAQALGTRDVVLTRSAKAGGAPTVPSRFLTRLLALVGADAETAMIGRGGRHVLHARLLDDRPPEPRFERPRPAPPVAVRPRTLSVTEIERWIRDPYAIYARHVLRLSPLPGLGERPDFGTRGSAVHDALARFSREWEGPFDETAVAALVAIGREEFRALEAFPEVHALWWPRFEAAARWLVPAFEAGRGDVRRFAEVTGRWVVIPGEDGFVLRGRADRIDLVDDGWLSIVDFKTGAAPSDKQIAAGLTPQLALEAAIARRGGFEGVPAGEAADLTHVVLRGIAGKNEVRSFRGMSGKEGTKSVADVITETEARLLGLVTAYRRPETGYLSRAHPLKRAETGDFDHLARVGEWSIGSDDEEAEG
jgi:ATP-dependent helicase/nuclease subunit B